MGALILVFKTIYIYIYIYIFRIHSFICLPAKSLQLCLTLCNPASLLSPALANGFFTTSANWEVHSFLYLASKGPYSQSYGFSSSQVWMWKLDSRKLSTKELMFLNCGVREDSWESLDCKEIQPVHPKGNQSLVFIGRTNVEAETLILWPPEVKNWCWKRPWCWERMKAGGEGDDRKWDGWMASLTRWTWVWESSGSWWWAGKPGLLQSMGPQRVGKDRVTELKWFYNYKSIYIMHNILCI